jgi:alpha-tubulin suppressor-like RCC1 family protein
VTGLGSGVQAIAGRCAIVNGGAQCWGDNTWGQVGNVTSGKIGPWPATTLPVQVQGLDSGVQAIASGSAHVCAIVNNRVWCWGNNVSGELGNNTTNRYANEFPVPVNPWAQ